MNYRTIVGVLVLLSVLGSTAPSHPQESKDSSPKTKLEAFTGKVGVVSIKSYTEVGSLKAIGQTIDVTAITIRDAKTGAATSGIIVEAVEPKSYLVDRSRSYVDIDEVPGLLEGLDYISKIDHSVTKMPFYEGQYSTRGDLKVIVFNNRQGLRNFSIRVGSIGGKSVFFPIDDLPKFQNLIGRAKAIIENPELAHETRETVAPKSNKVSQGKPSPISLTPQTLSPSKRH